MTESLENISVEAALDDARSTAKRLAKAAKELEAASRALDQAAAKGLFTKLSPAVERTSAIHQQIGEELQELTSSWVVDDDAVGGVLDQHLMSEVEESLKRQGVALHRYGNGWSASPVLIRFDSKGRSLKIDKARLPSLRPSVIAAAIVAARQRQSVRPEQFIEILLVAYRATVGSISLTNSSIRLGSSVPLSEVYKSLTLLPDSRREYSIESFTRDLFLLDRSGISTTQDGQQVFLSASTSSKSGSGVLTVLDETGAPQNYFAVAFREIPS